MKELGLTLNYLLVLACLSLAVANGWITDRNFNFRNNFRDVRRSRNCYGSNEECLLTNQCCKERDVCLLDRKQSLYTGREIGRCQNIDQQKKITKDTRQEGDRCSDSYDCGLGLCCRSILLYRYGSVQKCGKSEGPYMCISREDEVYDALFDQYD